MPFLAHLEELRARLIRVFIASFLGFIACYFVANPIMEALTWPAIHALEKVNAQGRDVAATMHFTGFMEPILVQLKTSFLAGLMLTSPYIFYQMWEFIAPGLYEKERRTAIFAVIASTLLFVGGSLFGYFVVFPIGFQYLLGYALDAGMSPMLTMGDYFSLATKLLFVFGLSFEMPLILYVLGRLGLVTVDQLRRGRRYAIVGIFIVAAIITPPDPITQTLMAVPMVILYEISIWLSAVGFRRRAKEKAAAPQPEADGASAGT